MLWSTYYGYGNITVSGQGIATDRNGNVFVTGFTNGSSDLSTNGAYQTSYGGGQDDAFLVKFNNNGARQWGTYFGGSKYDDGSAIAIDSIGYIYITGYTSSPGMATNGAYQTTVGGKYGSDDAFLAKFNNNGGIEWATYYGGEGSDVGNGVAIDVFGNIYIVGYTESVTGIATIGAYQPSYGGTFQGSASYEAFLTKFDINGNMQWATYFGNSNGTDGHGIASDPIGNIYITGGTSSSSMIATSGGYQAVYAGNTDAFLAKFGQTHYDAGISSIAYPIGVSCPDSEPVIVQLKNFGSNKLNSVNIEWAVNHVRQPVYHWIGTLLPDSFVNITIGQFLFFLGKDTIKSWTSKPNGIEDSIPANDTSSAIIIISPSPKADAGVNKIICSNTPIGIGNFQIIGDTYSWTSYPQGFSSSVSDPIVSPSITTTYYLLVTDQSTGCTKKDSVVVNVNHPPIANIATSKPICIGDSTNIGGVAISPYIYNWSSTPGGFKSFISNPWVLPQSSTEYKLLVVDTVTHCSNLETIYITVNPLPVPNTGQSTYSICIGTRIKIGANAQPHFVYSWTSNPTGFSSTRANPVVNPANNTVYNLSVTDTATGCTNNNSAQIFVGIAHAPIVDPGKNQSVCAGVLAHIGSNSVSGNTYSWTSNPMGFTSTTAKPIVLPKQTTSYSLTVTNSTGCTNFDSVTVTVNPRPIPDPGKPRNLCTGAVLHLGAPTIAGDTYSWTSKPKGFSSKISDPTDSPNTTTEYFLKETISSTGCADSDSVRVTIVPRPNIEFDAKNINGYEYQFTVKKPNYPSLNYHWNFGSSTSSDTNSTGSATSDTASGYNVYHTYTKNGKYNVVLIDSLPGYCTEIDSYLVIINEAFSLNIFPNPFGIQTDINYTLVKPGHVRISLVDEIGRLLGTLLDKQLNQGEYNTYFDAALWKTRPAMYFILFQLDDKLIVKKMIQIDSIYH